MFVTDIKIHDEIFDKIFPIMSLYYTACAAKICIARLPSYLRKTKDIFQIISFAFIINNVRIYLMNNLDAKIPLCFKPLEAQKTVYTKLKQKNVFNNPKIKKGGGGHILPLLAYLR